MLSPSFKLPPLDLKLVADEIHIWFAVLGQPLSRLHTFIETLSIEERIRAEHFYFERDRKNFIVRRGILRRILGCYLNVEPGRLQFHYGENGKPELADAFGNGTVHFNLSHSDGVALFAFACHREIGADIEYIRDIPEMDKIAEQIFSVREKRIFRGLVNEQKKEAFFNCWTRKEALIKAIGDGFSRSLDEFDVALNPGLPAGLREIGTDSKTAFRWFVQDLKPAPGFAAAFAVEGRGWELHCWQFCA
jgi:4'-phosphopantetheinyl transferase